MTAHAVGHHENVGMVGSVSNVGFRQAGPADPHGSRHLRNQKVVLVGRPDQAAIGEAKASHRRQRLVPFSCFPPPE
jgi:hypothetical protein